MRLRAACLLALLAAPALPAQAVLAPDTSWVARAAIYQVFVRDFSPRGDFRGVIEGLDRIAASGANTIWLMPIHPIGTKDRKGTLGSPYAATDHAAINPDFGTAADFRALVRAVHARGMKVILDFVPNHTAAGSRWLREQPDFFVRDSAGRPVTPRNEKGEPTDWTDVIQLDYGNPLMRAAMVATMRRWLVVMRTSISGCLAWKRCSLGANQPSAKVVTRLTLSVPELALRPTRSNALVMRSKASRRSGSSASPSLVISRPRGRRTNSATPSRSSSAFT